MGDCRATRGSSRCAVETVTWRAFFDGVQQVALQTGATLERFPRAVKPCCAPPMRSMNSARRSISSSCCTWSRPAVALFPGTKLRGVAEAAGLVLESRRCVPRPRRGRGRAVFGLANLGAERLRCRIAQVALATNGLTLSLDVPRVPMASPHSIACWTRRDDWRRL
jgi:hypothetical protein